jgi:alkylated DNA nucleotide flippase Atl1
MKNVTDKYRGQTVYFHVMAELVRAAQYGGVTTYQDIAVIMGLPTTGNHMGRETGQILGEISEDEVNAGRPMLSSVAVGVTGRSGSGFFTLARELGLLQEGEEETVFWRQQCAAAYRAWKRPLQ